MPLRFRKPRAVLCRLPLPRAAILAPTFPSLPSSRPYSSAPAAAAVPEPQRALLYVPGSSPPSRLDKVLSNGLAGVDGKGRGQPDVLILDLEDSVREEKKSEARDQVLRALENAPADCRSKKYVRINSQRQGLDDLDVILRTKNLDGLVLPKVHTSAALKEVDHFVQQYGLPEHEKLKIVASIESPEGLGNMKEIVRVSGKVGALLFAAEDYCASSFLLRSPSRTEMTYARQSLVACARAHGLGAVDLVCVEYKGEEAQRVLEEEAREGRAWGFSGKQVIHPSQVETVQRAFSPAPADIARALRILEEYEAGRQSGAGAYGLKGEDGKTVMIDAPMLLQAQSILAQARSAGLLEE
ncbi:hypothetical protein JCM10213_008416 [Rhodosporidiobolus nylandii]